MKVRKGTRFLLRGVRKTARADAAGKAAANRCSDGALVFGLVADVCGFALKGLRAFPSTHILM